MHGLYLRCTDYICDARTIFAIHGIYLRCTDQSMNVKSWFTFLQQRRILSLSRASRKKPTFLHSISPKSTLVLFPTYGSLLFRSGLPTKTLYAFLFCPIQATRPTRPLILNVIIRTTFGEEINDEMVSYHDGMARPLVADDGDRHQMWWVGVSTLYKQSRTAYRGWSFSLDSAQGANDWSP
jgi:hypothetical protein